MPLLSVCTLENISTQLLPGSIELQQYLEGVYGATGNREAVQRSLAWKWDAVDVIWMSLLPTALRRCKWPSTPTGQGSIFSHPKGALRASGTLWRYAHPTYCACCGMTAIFSVASRTRIPTPQHQA